MFLFQSLSIDSYFPNSIHYKIVGSFSQGKEMLALKYSKNHIREFFESFKWTPSSLFSPTSTVNYSWTVSAYSVTKAKRPKICWIASYSIFDNKLQNIIFHVDKIMTVYSMFLNLLALDFLDV